MAITRDLQETLQRAVHEASKRHHEYLTLEHLLYALCADPTGIKVLVGCGANLDRIRSELEGFFEGRLESRPDLDEEGPKMTSAGSRVLQRAALHMAGAGKQDIDAGGVIASMMRERESFAVYVLEREGVRRLDVLRFISHGTSIAKGSLRAGSNSGVDSGPNTAAGHQEESDEEGGEAPGGNPLERFTVNLVERAKKGQIDPLIGRATELARMVQVLCRRRKNNPVLVGDPGVGKTAIVEGLALAVAENRVPAPLKDAPIYALDMGSVLAGTRYRGDFEERLKGVMAAIQKEKGAILFIDEIHTIVGAGATSGGSLDASNLLKPALASGELRCIGSTTFSEYKASFDRDRALGRRFQKIEVNEPTVEETVQILRGLRPRYEAYHEVRYSDDSLEPAAELSAKFIQDRFLPDKAIDVLDEAGARNRLLAESERKATIGPAEMEVVVATMAKIPEKTVSADDEAALRNLEPDLRRVIFGQDHAVSQVVSAIKLGRAGLGGVDKPIGSFLFSGPTGVGKTELAKQLAKTLGVEFLRFDMTEYMEKHTVSRLIGAPPGYVGFDQGGLLTDAVRKTPHAVVLLDEIEKAHPDLFGLLLQVMDHATLTDNNGRKADFRHVVLIMTTNAGARDLIASKVGFGHSSQKATTAERSKAEIERTFSPEFRNRLDAWIAFDPLGTEAIMRVVERQVGELAAQLLDKKVTLEVSAEAQKWLADKGYDPLFGARPMARVIQEEIKRPLADAILFGSLRHGGKVVVKLSHGKVDFAMTPQAS